MKHIITLSLLVCGQILSAQAQEYNSGMSDSLLPSDKVAVDTLKTTVQGLPLSVSAISEDSRGCVITVGYYDARTLDKTYRFDASQDKHCWGQHDERYGHVGFKVVTMGSKAYVNEISKAKDVPCVNLGTQATIDALAKEKNAALLAKFGIDKIFITYHINVGGAVLDPKMKFGPQLTSNKSLIVDVAMNSKGECKFADTEALDNQFSTWQREYDERTKKTSPFIQSLPKP
jgi:hypothetical protein